MGRDPQTAPAVDSPGANDPLIGKELGGCRLEKLIGTGGMGRVYLARHLTLQKPVAVKVLRCDLPADTRGVDRFLLEARAAGRLEHPRIVPIYDAGRQDHTYYIVMQYVRGESLAARLKRGKMSLHEAIRVFRAVAEAVDFAHAHGVIHRDIKPDNVLLGDGGEVKLTDFGLARMVQGDANLSRSGDVIGSPNFMSPEQALGKRADARTDIYGLGATLYQLVTGSPPFKAPNPISVIMKVIHQPLRPPHTFAPKVSRPLSDLIVAMMQKKRSSRPASVKEVLSRLQAVEARLAAVGSGGRSSRWILAVAAALAIVSGVGAGAFLGTSPWRFLKPWMLGFPGATAWGQSSKVDGPATAEKPSEQDPEIAALDALVDETRNWEGPGPLSSAEEKALLARCEHLRETLEQRDVEGLREIVHASWRAGRGDFGADWPRRRLRRLAELLKAADLSAARFVPARAAAGEMRVLVVLTVADGETRDQVLSLPWVRTAGQWYWEPRRPRSGAAAAGARAGD